MDSTVVHGSIIQAGTVMVIGAARPIPRQLPAAPTTFVGRAEEAANLDRHLLGRAMPVAIVSGSGGMGKTSLALVWAHRVQRRFPDGQLFVDLHGFSQVEQPVRAMDALGGFLDALGVARERLPDDMVQRAALYRSLLADKRMLVVLDNAASTDQVLPLLPGGPGCAVVITSRDRLRGLSIRHSARSIHLGALSEAESHAFMSSAIDPVPMADAEAVNEVIRLCRGLPLALGLVVAKLRVPLAGTVAELRELGLEALDSEEPRASLPTVLSWSLRHLSTQQRTVFALLAAAPGPDIGLEAAAHLFGMPVLESRRALEALAEVSLLHRLPSGRHTMHDLVRAYGTTAADSLPAEVRDRAIRRVFDYYTYSAHTGDQLLNPHHDPVRPLPPTADIRPVLLSKPAAAWAWFDAEHVCLLAVQRLAIARADHHTVWWLAWSMDTFHFRRGHRDRRVSAWRSAIDAAPHLPEPALVMAHRYCGIACGEVGKHTEAFWHLHEALAHAAADTDPTQRARAHQGLAWVWGTLGADEQALAHASHALKLFRVVGNAVWQAAALNTMGWHAALLSDLDSARTHCKAALDLLRGQGNPNGEAAALDSLGYIEHQSGHHLAAVRYYRRSLELRSQVGNAHRIANTLDGLGHPHAALGQFDQARTVWRHALDIYRAQQREDDVTRIAEYLEAIVDTLAQTVINPASAKSAER
ncbi:tetratricopeptide (TPR) repeat protein [Actinokineospora baliensis]|uniref:ATP-binding protein n=1 Tax=Actinokineospora baliensis TaxID=547056 RepID=UPI00195754DC|nr:tetratricopeptide repeat protein [Actinokineospora baliensis]MBM7773934.1 tetratricopeptide (TPR) repeat protein [Actinokineospora baliensis]